jgi:outer membrane protein TolC
MALIVNGLPLCGVLLPMKRHVFAIALAALAFPSASWAQQRADTLRLSLQDAITRALQESDEVRLATAQADVADAQVGMARATALPQLRINSQYQHVYENARANAVGQLFNQPNTYSANLVLSQTIFQGGRIFAGMRAATDARSATRFDDAEVRARLTVDVQRAYMQVLFTTKMIDIQEQNLSLATARAHQVEQLAAAGRAARYDVLRAGVERANIEPLVIQARNDREIAVLDLKRLLNIPVTQSLSLTTTIDGDAMKLIDVALADTTVAPDRASVRSAELQVLSRREGVTVARADLLPTASLSLSNGYQAFPPLGMGFPSSRGFAANEFCAAGSPTTSKCQNGGWFTDRSITATISLPIFDGMRAKSNIDLARAQLQLAETQLRLQREAVGLEVARARAELNRARSVFGARQQTVADAKEAFDLASLRFERGLSTQLEVSDAQLALLTAESTEARATFDVFLASAELARSLGRPIPLPPTTSGARSSDNRPPRD